MTDAAKTAGIGQNRNVGANIAAQSAFGRFFSKKLTSFFDLLLLSPRDKGNSRFTLSKGRLDSAAVMARGYRQESTA